MGSWHGLKYEDNISAELERLDEQFDWKGVNTKLPRSVAPYFQSCTCPDLQLNSDHRVQRDFEISISA